jgi:hypothetical protein
MSLEINMPILDHVEAIGGVYVWERETFIVALLDVPVADDDIAPLRNLVGVEQVALNARSLSWEALDTVARIPGLRSLVLADCALSEREVDALRRLVPEVLRIAGDS